MFYHEYLDLTLFIKFNNWIVCNSMLMKLFRSIHTQYLEFNMISDSLHAVQLDPVLMWIKEPAVQKHERKILRVQGLFYSTGCRQVERQWFGSVNRGMTGYTKTAVNCATADNLRIWCQEKQKQCGLTIKTQHNNLRVEYQKTLCLIEDGFAGQYCWSLLPGIVVIYGIGPSFSIWLFD